MKAKAPISTEQLLQIRLNEITVNGISVWTDKRKTVEEMLKMRGVKF